MYFCDRERRFWRSETQFCLNKCVQDRHLSGVRPMRTELTIQAGVSISTASSHPTTLAHKGRLCKQFTPFSLDLRIFQLFNSRGVCGGGGVL